jgi:hypothetical protein
VKESGSGNGWGGPIWRGTKKEGTKSMELKLDLSELLFLLRDDTCRNDRSESHHDIIAPLYPKPVHCPPTICSPPFPSLSVVKASRDGNIHKETGSPLYM